MSRQSRFSLYNNLPLQGDAWERFELNPVCVDGDGAPAFGLSTLLVGPPLGHDEDRLDLELVCDDDVTVLEAIAHRSERLPDGTVLTIGLFGVSRRLLAALIGATTTRIRLSGSAGRVRRELTPSNRGNVGAFLETTRPEPAAGARPHLASAAG